MFIPALIFPAIIFWLDNSPQADAEGKVQPQPAQVDGYRNCAALWTVEHQDVETEDHLEPEDVCFENIREKNIFKNHHLSFFTFSAPPLMLDCVTMLKTGYSPPLLSVQYCATLFLLLVRP